jgi:hypothetical protein
MIIIIIIIIIIMVMMMMTTIMISIVQYQLTYTSLISQDNLC